MKQRSEWVFGVFALIGISASGCYLLSSHNDSTPESPYDKETAADAPSAVSFPEGERLLGPAIKKWTLGYSNPPPTVLRAYLGADDWAMLRHEGTQRILGRGVPVFVYYRGDKCGEEQSCRPGQCYQYDCNLVEDEEGGGHWGRPHLDCPAETYIHRVTCASVDRLPNTPP
jgi:hypothetical protein